MGKHLNPLEKEFLVKKYKGNPTIKLSECKRYIAGTYERTLKIEIMLCNCRKS